MSGLLYREDIVEVRRRLTTWWNGGDIGRPVLQITCPCEKPLETFPAMPEPKGWVTWYSTRNYAYRVHLSKVGPGGAQYHGEAVPAVAPDLAPNCVALYLGCKGEEMPGTVWCEPCIASPETAKFEFTRDNFYWNFSRQLGAEQVRLGRGKFFVAFPDLIEGLDTLSAMRGNEKLLFDLIERPEWVRESLAKITALYFHYYDILYDMFRDEVGGSVFWAWAPGRMSKFQCDFSAMISPDMFGEFMVPVLTEMTERVAYCMYHWDGPGAIPHHDHLLSIPGLDMLQWTPGAGVEQSWHRRWWPLYHKSFEHKKKLLIGCDTLDTLRALKREFGVSFKQFMINMVVKTPAEAEEALKIAAE